MNQAGKGSSGGVGSVHPSPENIPHSNPTDHNAKLHKATKERHFEEKKA